MLGSLKTRSRLIAESKAGRIAKETLLDVSHLLRAVPQLFSSSQYKKSLQILKNAEKSKGIIDVPLDSPLNRDYYEQMFRMRREGMFFLTWDVTKLNYVYGFFALFFLFQFYQLLLVDQYRAEYALREAEERANLSDDYEEPPRHRVLNQ